MKEDSCEEEAQALAEAAASPEVEAVPAPPSSASAVATAPPVSAWREKPYRILFPLGLALAWSGVLHWLLLALGVIDEYRNVFHAMVQIQGFLTCFATGFLLTAIPRRTQTPPASRALFALAILAPIGVAVAAWGKHWALAQVAWLALVVALLGFAVRRFTSRGAGRRPPLLFVWIPFGFLLGVAGALASGAYGSLGEEYKWLHDLGTRMLLQGFVLSLVIGVGALALPLMTRGEAPADLRPEERGLIALQGVLMAIFLASFPLEVFGHRAAGLALRGSVVLWALVVHAGIYRLPTRPGWNTWLIWAAAWFVPLGYLVGAVDPVHWKGALHLTFLGGFALLTFGVSAHVSIAHGHRPDDVRAHFWRTPLLFGLVVAAAASRLLFDLDATRAMRWLGVAAASFLVASVIWASIVLPRVWPRRSGRTS